MPAPLTRTPRPHLAGRPTHVCPRDGVLLTHDDAGRVELAESLSTTTADGRTWSLTRHEPAYSRRPLYWLATPIRRAGDADPVPGALLSETQYTAPTLARLLQVLEGARSEVAA